MNLLNDLAEKMAENAWKQGKTVNEVFGQLDEVTFVDDSEVPQHPVKITPELMKLANTKYVAIKLLSMF
jgi:sulfur relay (sulfurtransferase) complex TusBCD TusD component (DsrE family)